MKIGLLDSHSRAFSFALTSTSFVFFFIGLDKSSEEINFMKNTTLLSFITDMFRQLPLPSSV